MTGEPWSGFTALVRRSERLDEPGLPIKLGPCSNGEYAPLPVQPRVRAAARLARATCEDAARRLGMSRRDFLRSSMASAATLLAIGACSGDDDEPSAGTFDVPPESTTEPEVSTTVLDGGGAPVLDVQQHLLELEGYDGGFGARLPAGGLRRRRCLLRHRALARPGLRTVGHHHGRALGDPGARVTPTRSRRR